MLRALQLLDRCAEIGAALRPGVDGALVVCAGPRPVPVELVRQLRDAKTEILAALAAPTTDPAWWRREYHVRTIHWLVAPRTLHEAEALAWGELQNRWHRLHGSRSMPWQCAGCDAPIGGLPALDLGDGNRVHLSKIDCLIRYGARWRGEAEKALVAFGLIPPKSEE